jgi:lipoyl(octanoyl) transferase
MDLEPFSRINPCGFSNLQVIDLRTLGVVTTLAAVQETMLRHLQIQLAGAR